MEIAKDILIIDLALYLKSSKTLIISDLHIGYEESLNSAGVMVPRTYFAQMYDRIRVILEENLIENVIINGDLKHDFGTIAKTEWRHTLMTLELFKGKKIIIIKGNHDVMLAPIAGKASIELVDYFIQDDILIAHGDVALDLKSIERQSASKINMIIIGHEHPAITFTSNSRKETFKCFLIGKIKDKNRQLVVMPSFNTVTYGSDVLTGKRFSPYLDQDISGFKVIAIGDKPYDFGKIKDIMKSIR